MEPGDLYVMGIVVTALFVAPFNALARVVVLSWIVAHLFWALGAPEQLANIGGQACVFFLGMRHTAGSTQLLAWILSLPIILVSIAWFGGLIEPEACWMVVLIAAMLQLIMLPWSIAGETFRAVLRAWHDTADEGFFREGASV
jgi:hypothetical protein